MGNKRDGEGINDTEILSMFRTRELGLQNGAITMYSSRKHQAKFIVRNA